MKYLLLLFLLVAPLFAQDVGKCMKWEVVYADVKAQGSETCNHTWLYSTEWRDKEGTNWRSTVCSLCDRLEFQKQTIWNCEKAPIKSEFETEVESIDCIFRESKTPDLKAAESSGKVIKVTIKPVEEPIEEPIEP